MISWSCTVTDWAYLSLVVLGGRITYLVRNIFKIGHISLVSNDEDITIVRILSITCVRSILLFSSRNDSMKWKNSLCVKEMSHWLHPVFNDMVYPMVWYSAQQKGKIISYSLLDLHGHFELQRKSRDIILKAQLCVVQMYSRLICFFQIWMLVCVVIITWTYMQQFTSL